MKKEFMPPDENYCKISLFPQYANKMGGVNLLLHKCPMECFMYECNITENVS